jgi:hypothetical protein
MAGIPVGVYVVLDPTVSAEVTLVSSGSSISSLFGTETCGTLCIGGVTGVFVSEPWSDFQSTSFTRSTNTTTLNIDPNTHLMPVMNNINGIETNLGYSLKLTLGLKAGSNAAYDVLDMYAAVGNGSFGGSLPNLTTTITVVRDDVEGACKFQSYSGDTPTSDGKTFGTNGFPEQCMLRSDASNKLTCIPQPRMWGTDTNSPTANTLYQHAYIQALQDYVNFVNGVTGYHGPVAHAVQALKLAGIANHDEEIAIDGNPALAMPYYGGSLLTCGYTGATDAEEVWTKQIMEGPPFSDAYESGIMESTWLSLVASSASITHTGSVPLSFIIDVVGNNQFPPVQPAHCSSASGTNCAYTSAGDALIPHLTTGEMEYLIEEVLSGSLVSTDHLLIQDQGLQANTPDNDLSIDNTYQSQAIPCAMNALEGTGIGYQSGGTTISSPTSKAAYLASITNGAAYGAQYIELLPEHLDQFINDTTDAIPFNGMSSYGTTTGQNIDMLARTIAAAEAVMATNNANSTSGTLCPLPEEVTTSPPMFLNWSYP